MSENTNNITVLGILTLLSAIVTAYDFVIGEYIGAIIFMLFTIVFFFAAVFLSEE